MAAQRKEQEPEDSIAEVVKLEGSRQVGYREGYEAGLAKGRQEGRAEMLQQLAARHRMPTTVGILPLGNHKQEHPLASPLAPPEPEPEPEDPKSWPGKTADKIKRFLRRRTPPHGASYSDIKATLGNHASLKAYRMAHQGVIQLDGKFYLRDQLRPDDVRRWEEQEAKRQALRKSKR